MRTVSWCGFVEAEARGDLDIGDPLVPGCRIFSQQGDRCLAMVLSGTIMACGELGTSSAGVESTPLAEGDLRTPAGQFRVDGSRERDFRSAVELCLEENPFRRLGHSRTAHCRSRA